MSGNPLSTPFPDPVSHGEDDFPVETTKRPTPAESPGAAITATSSADDLTLKLIQSDPDPFL